MHRRFDSDFNEISSDFLTLKKTNDNGLESDCLDLKILTYNKVQISVYDNHNIFPFNIKQLIHWSSKICNR